MIRDIKWYDILDFGSGGRMQIAHALGDAKNLVRKYSVPFVIGFTRPHREIAVAPISERDMFIDPMAAIITEGGSWSISDMHSHRFLQPRGIVGTPEDIKLFRGGDDSAVVFSLYNVGGYGHKQCGGFEAGNLKSVHSLERAVEDAAKLAHEFGDEPGYAALCDDGAVRACRKSGREFAGARDFFEVRPRGFLDGSGVLLRDRVSDAAKNAYEQFCQVA